MPVAIVTGASGGIGLATCKALLASNFSVLGTDITSPPPLTSPTFHFLQANITESSAATQVVAEAVSKFGQVDALLNVAGLMDYLQCVDTLEEEMWDRILAVNLKAPVRLMGEAVKQFRRQGGGGGAIVNVGSYAGISGAAAGVAYTCSKHGLVGATKQTAFRFKGEGIRCNIILPGGVVTGIMANHDQSKLDMGMAQALGPIRNAAHPDELILQPDNVAAQLVHLVSESSKGVNGAVISVDNGWSTI